jgi:hypothetical protein
MRADDLGGRTAWRRRVHRHVASMSGPTMVVNMFEPHGRAPRTFALMVTS